MKLDQLEDPELLQIWDCLPTSEKTRSIMAIAEADGSVDALRDEAYGIYWRRRLDRLDLLQDSEIAELLHAPIHSTARRMLGEAARLDMLNEHQIQHLLATLKEGEWSWDQMNARALLVTCKARAAKGETLHDCSNTIARLIESHTTWAVVEMLPYLELEQLNELREVMRQRSVLTRWNRHDVRYAISQEAKRRG